MNTSDDRVVQVDTVSIEDIFLEFLPDEPNVELSELRKSCHQFVDKIYHPEASLLNRPMYQGLDAGIFEFADILHDYIDNITFDKLVNLESVLLKFNSVLEFETSRIRPIFDELRGMNDQGIVIKWPTPELIKELERLIEIVYLNDELMLFMMNNHRDTKKMIKIMDALTRLKDFYLNSEFKNIMLAKAMECVLLNS